MARNKEDKRKRILDAAAKLFAEQPFHKVLLDQVASAARVGKGTLYLYFKNKEELYIAMRLNGFQKLIAALEQGLAEHENDPEAQLAGIIDRLAGRLLEHPIMFKFWREAIIRMPSNMDWQEQLNELFELIEGVIQNGIEKGVFKDANPAATARYIAGLIRTLSMFRPEDNTTDELCRHAKQFVLNGLQAA